MKYITVKLTESQWNDVWRGVGYLMEDCMDDYTDDQNSYEAKYNRRVEKSNAYFRRLQDNIGKQLAQAKSKVTS